MNTTEHHHFMTTALQLAERGRLTTSPNPMVGCVLVKNHEFIGQGFHLRAGEPHAELHALQNAKVSTQGATAYITLEPCCHYGRTPPCTSALIQAGIKKVFIATLDPNPLVSGKGVEALRSAGIEVEIGLCETEAKNLNEIFFHYMKHKRPFVISKWAMSLDGKTITHSEDHPQISGQKAQFHTHQLRQQLDAILIGANTLRQDNPKLTVRLKQEAALKHPLRIVLAGQKPLPMQATLFDPNLPGKTLIAATQSSAQLSTISSVETLILPEDPDGKVDLKSLLDLLGKREITSLLVEGGMTVHQHFLKENLVNKIHTYLSPVFIGTLNTKQTLPSLKCTSLGQDFHLMGDLKEIPNV